MNVLYTICKSPIGPLVLTSDGVNLTGLYTGRLNEEASPDHGRQLDDRARPFAETKQQLAAYFEKRLKVFDLPLNLLGTEFQRAVWSELLKIRYGQVISYGELARRLNNAKAVRAVGLANGRNPVSIIVPCHRVIGANGSLTGYGGGLPRKQYLLGLEKDQLFLVPQVMATTVAATTAV